MLALKTSLNGKQLSIAGAEDLSVLHSIVNAVGKLGAHSHTRRKSENPDIFLSIGGLTGRAHQNDEHLRWTEQQKLSIGDEVTITVLDVEYCDTPTSRTPTQATSKTQEKLRYEQAKSLYLELRGKYEPHG